MRTDDVGCFGELRLSRLFHGSKSRLCALGQLGSVWSCSIQCLTHFLALLSFRLS